MGTALLALTCSGTGEPASGNPVSLVNGFGINEGEIQGSEMISSCWKSALGQRRELQEAKPSLHPTELLERTSTGGRWCPETLRLFLI